MAKPKIPENFFDDIETTAKKVAEESTLVNNDNQKNDERTSAKIVSIYEISFNEMNNMNDTEEEIESVSPGVKGQKVKMKLPIKCEKDWILRRKK